MGRACEQAWTKAEEATLVAAFKSGGVVAARKALPGRRKHQITGRASRLGLRRTARWTAKMDAELRLLWGQILIRGIAQRLGCTPMEVYNRGHLLGLGIVPQGMGYVWVEAKRMGYEVETLRRILAWAHVRILLAYVRPGGAKQNQKHIVDTADAEAAVDRWHRTETLRAGAARVGLSDNALRLRLAVLGHAVVEIGEGRYRSALEEPGPTAGVVRVAPLQGRGNKRGSRMHIRVESELVDRAARLETLEQAAERLGRHRKALGRDLARAGLLPPGRRMFLLEPEKVDAAVAAEAKVMDLVAAATYAGVTKWRMAVWLREAGFERTSGFWRLTPEDVDGLVESRREQVAA